MLETSNTPLSEAYDVALLDLDGVVYIGPDAVPGAAEHLAAARDAGMHLAYVTNNAARTPGAVADHLRDLGVEVADEDVVSSAHAAARLLADELPAGARVFVIGGEGLLDALREEGLEPVQEPGDDIAAVVSGYHPELVWRTVIQGAILVRKGLPWVASNTDMTVPTPQGAGPGNGVLVQAVAGFAEREPTVAGKPRPPLFEETLRRVGGERPLVVGDRLDTDIAGAVAVGHDSLLVMTGVTDAAALVAAAPAERPTYVAADLAALGAAQPVPDRDGEETVLGGWRATVSDGRLQVTGEGTPDDWWRVVATAGWAHLDAHDRPVEVQGPPGAGTVAPEHGTDADQEDPP